MNLVAVVDRAREVVASLGKDVRRVGKNDIVVFVVCIEERCQVAVDTYIAIATKTYSKP